MDCRYIALIYYGTNYKQENKCGRMINKKTRNNQDMLTEIDDNYMMV